MLLRPTRTLLRTADPAAGPLTRAGRDELLTAIHLTAGPCTDCLRSGLVPAQLRARLFRTALLIPGVRLVDSAADLDGRIGVAVGRNEGTSYRDEIIFAETGEYIGEREVQLRSDSGFPAGTVTTFSAVTTGVADTAP